MLGSQNDGTGVSTTIFMGGTRGNSSDEEILQGMQVKFGDGELDLEKDGGIGRGKMYGHTKSIHKTTQIDVSYDDQ
jgi:hypothetical protein